MVRRCVGVRRVCCDPLLNVEDDNGREGSELASGEVSVGWDWDWRDDCDEGRCEDWEGFGA